MNVQDLRNLKVIVYGVGTTAVSLVPILKRLKINIIGYAVTEDLHSSKLPDPNISLRRIADYAPRGGGWPEDTCVLISAGMQFHAEMEKMCQDLGIKKIVPLTRELRLHLAYECAMEYFAEKGISLQGDTISFNKGLTLINYFQENAVQNATIFSIMADLVFPEYLNDDSLSAEGPYELGEVRLNPGDVVLDCGANVGIFSAIAASKKCLSYAFEPTPSSFSVVERYNQIYKDQIIPVPYAVSDQVGTTTFYVIPDTIGSSNSLIEGSLKSRGGEEITVDTITIDEFVRSRNLKKVDFIKADIEGAERFMLAGAQDTLKHFAPKLALCTYHLPDDEEVLTKLILQANPNYHIHYGPKKLYAWV